MLMNNIMDQTNQDPWNLALKEWYGDNNKEEEKVIDKEEEK